MAPDEPTAEERAALERLSAEERAVLDRVLEATAALGETGVAAAGTYGWLDPQSRALGREARLDGQEQIERIAKQWRQAELTGATEPSVIEELQSEPVLSLAAAIEDSLILALTADSRHRELMLSLDEAIERTGALVGYRDPPEELAHPQAEKADETEEERGRRFDDLNDLVVNTVQEGLDVYVALRDCGEPDEDALRESLKKLAVSLRTCDVERGLVAAFSEREDLRGSIGLLRTMLHGVVLRLSEDPARQAQAIPPSELGARGTLLIAEWKAANRRTAERARSPNRLSARALSRALTRPFRRHRDG